MTNRGSRRWEMLFILVCGLVMTSVPAGAADAPANLATASSEDLLKVYSALRHLEGSEQRAIAENVVWKRDAGTITFRSGKLAFAAPVAGHVVAAVFTGEGVFKLTPPTAMDQRQISRFTRQPQLEDGFREAVFFFTDNSWDELNKLVHIQGGGDASATGNALASAESRYAEKLNGWWESERTGGFPMRNLPARMLADLTDPGSRGLFLADIKSEHHDNLLFHISWNRDPLLPAGLDTSEEVALMHWKRGEYSEWWSGFHLAAEYARDPHPSHRELAAHCSTERIDAEIGKDNRLAATAEMEFSVLNAGARVLPFNLDSVLRISALTDDAGKKLSFIQEGRELDSDPWLLLPEPAAAGRTYKIKVAYEEDSTRDSRIVHQQGSGLFFVTARESWYPSFGAFDDRTRFTLDFRSPKKYTFVATGRRLSEEKEGDSIETQWQSEMPDSVAGFNYGSFVEKSKSDKDLDVTVYAGQQVPDELKNIESQMDMANLARGSLGVGEDAEAQAGILTGGFNTTSMAGYAAAESFQAFKLYEHFFGSLPYKMISVTEQPVGFFGQSWPTLIFLPYLSLMDNTTLHSLHLRENADEREFFDTVAVHEMSHQWWGHMVGWKTYHDQWLSEGFADFSAALYLSAFEPKKFKAYWDLKRLHLLSNNGSGHRTVDVGPLWLNQQTNSYLEPRNSTLLIYEKGAYVLQMLRTLMEDPRSPEPDGAFIAAMHDFVSTCAGKNPSTGDFERVMEKHFGGSLDWFFNEWVYGTEVPRYDFSYQLKGAGDGKSVLHYALVQSDVSDSFVMRVPIYAYLNGSPRRLGFISVKGPTTSAGDVPLPVTPEKVTLDEYHTILAIEK